jgi:hypothetical protein
MDPDLAADAFIYGFPLVFNLQQCRRVVNDGIGAVPPTPINTFGHATELAGPEATFVSINNDTVYSMAVIDTSGGPVRLDVPDTAGRYYVLQFIDAWTNNFAYIGHRATGTAAGSFLLAPPDWEGDEPAIRCPTTVAVIVGRWAVDGDADLPAVRELQAGLTLTPSGGGEGIPDAGPGFFEQMRAWMRAFAPAPRDLEYQRRFEQPVPLDEAPGRDRLEYALAHSSSPKQNGWDLTYHVFDYNLDFFEVGALDDPRWKLPDGPERYLLRAAAARGGLWGNHGYEAAYAMVYEDAGGRPLDGDHRYELRFPVAPPCRAFWSVTMYDTPDFFLVENPIGRYSIGDRTPGLQLAGDGSLTIVMQRDEPAEADRRANWLPTPAGTFRPILRMYEPDDAVFDGGYELPPITRVDP